MTDLREEPKGEREIQITGGYLCDARAIRQMFFHWHYLKTALWFVAPFLTLLGMGAKNRDEFVAAAWLPCLLFSLAIVVPVAVQMLRHLKPKKVRYLIDENQLTWWVDEKQTTNPWNTLRPPTKLQPKDPNIWWLGSSKSRLIQYSILKSAFSTGDQEAVERLLVKHRLVRDPRP
jgi:hypothetical protein